MTSSVHLEPPKIVSSNVSFSKTLFPDSKPLLFYLNQGPRPRCTCKRQSTDPRRTPGGRLGAVSGLTSGLPQVRVWNTPVRLLCHQGITVIVFIDLDHQSSVSHSLDLFMVVVHIEEIRGLNTFSFHHRTDETHSSTTVSRPLRGVSQN